MLNEGTHRNVDRTERLFEYYATGHHAVQDAEHHGRLHLPPLSGTQHEQKFADSPIVNIPIRPHAGIVQHRRRPEPARRRGQYASTTTRPTSIANYDETFGGVHHLSGTFGHELRDSGHSKRHLRRGREQLLSVDLDDLNLASQNEVGSENDRYRRRPERIRVCWAFSAVSTMTTRADTSSK